MYRPLLVAALLIGVLSGLVKEGTLAFFTSTAMGSSSTFTAGSVTLSTTETSGQLAASGLLPGSSNTAEITVQNPSSSSAVTLRYSMAIASSGSASLASTLQATIKAGTCPGNDPALYSGPGTSGGFGDVTVGAQADDRQLAPGASEVLCFTITLPPTATASLQNTTATITYTFTAEQVAGT